MFWPFFWRFCPENHSLSHCIMLQLCRKAFIEFMRQAAFQQESGILQYFSLSLLSLTSHSMWATVNLCTWTFIAVSLNIPTELRTRLSTFWKVLKHFTFSLYILQYTRIRALNCCYSLTIFLRFPIHITVTFAVVLQMPRRLQLVALITVHYFWVCSVITSMCCHQILAGCQPPPHPFSDKKCLLFFVHSLFTF